MVDTIKTFVKSLGTFESVPATQVSRATYEDNGSQALNRLTIDFTQDIKSGTYNPFYNREFKYDVDGTEIFGGRVEKQMGNEGTEPIYTVDCWSYGGQFLTKLVNEIYENVSPEYVIEDLINRYTDLTYASSVVTGTTVERIVFRDRPLSEALQTIANQLGFFFTTDSDKKIYFEQWGSQSSGLVFDVTGGDVLYKPQWEYNTNEVITTVTVEGGIQQFNTSETFTATASQTDFVVLNQPVGSVKVTVNGVVKDPEVSDQTDGDYYVKIEDKTIVLKVGASAGQTVVITYSYNIKIKVKAVSEVFDDDGNQIVKEGKVTNKALKSTQEARSWAREYLAVNSTPQKSTVIPYKGFPVGAASGRRCIVIDSDEGINEEFIIESIVYTYETGISEITVGGVKANLFDWQAQVNEKLRTLSQDDTDEQKLQLYRNFETSAEITSNPGAVISITSPANSFVLGHATLGRLRSGKEIEADCSDNGNLGTWFGTDVSTGDQYEIPSDIINDILVEDSVSSSSTTKIARRADTTYFESTGTTYNDVAIFYYGTNDVWSFGTTGLWGYSSSPSNFLDVNPIILGGKYDASNDIFCTTAGVLKLFDRFNSPSTGPSYIVPSGFREAMDYDDITDTAVFVGAGDSNGTILVVESLSTTPVESYYSSTTISSPTGVCFDGDTSSIVLVDGTNKVFASFSTSTTPAEIPLQRLNCGVFDGTRYVLSNVNADDIITNINNCSICGFFEFNAVTGVTERIFTINNTNVSSLIYARVDASDPNKITFGYKDGAGYQKMTSPITAGTKYGFMITFDSGTVSLYIDDASPQTDTQTLTTLGAYPVKIGTTPNPGGELLNGKIDEFIIFDGVLTQADWDDIRNNNFYTNHSKYPTCKVWWSFDNPLLGNRRTLPVIVETI